MRAVTMSLIALIVLPVTGLWAQIPEEKDRRNLEQRLLELRQLHPDSLNLIVPERGRTEDLPRYTMPWVKPADPETARIPAMEIPDSANLHLRIKKYELQRVTPSDRQSDRYRRQQFTDR